MPSGKQPRFAIRKARLRRRLGRLQPFIPLLLHVLMGQAQQQVSIMSARMVDPKDGKITKALFSYVQFCDIFYNLFINFNKAFLFQDSFMFQPRINLSKTLRVGKGQERSIFQARIHCQGLFSAIIPFNCRH